MFLNPKELKKLMKEAFKTSHLIVGNRADVYYLQGRYWKLVCKKSFITKTILAEIIELTGEIPKEGECFCAGEEGNQMQINPMKIDADKEKSRVDVTDFLLTKRGVVQRILQSGGGRIFLVNNRFIGMTSGKHYDKENGETEPEGPYIFGDSEVYWKNNVMEFTAVLRVDEEHEQILKQMEMVDLTEVYET